MVVDSPKEVLYGGNNVTLSNILHTTGSYSTSYLPHDPRRPIIGQVPSPEYALSAALERQGYWSKELVQQQKLLTKAVQDVVIRLTLAVWLLVAVVVLVAGWHYGIW